MVKRFFGLILLSVCILLLSKYTNQSKAFGKWVWIGNVQVDQSTHFTTINGGGAFKGATADYIVVTGIYSDNPGEQIWSGTVHVDVDKKWSLYLPTLPNETYEILLDDGSLTEGASWDTYQP